MFYQYSKNYFWAWRGVLIAAHLQWHLYNYKIQKFYFIESALVCLTLWLLIIILVVVNSDSFCNSSLLFLCIISLSLIVMAFFISNNLIYFYIFFELSILPIFLIIIVWGYQRERLFARLSILLYTFMASLPLLFVLLLLNQKIRILTISNLNILLITQSPRRLWLSLSLLSAFLVKTPIYLTHMWLPKAHVEAPVFGSIILAAILLKMGTFGFIIIRALTNNYTFALIITSLRAWAIIRVALMCVKTVDIKVLVAYSSVSHIALLIILIFINSSLSNFRGGLIILSHGFTSSALFFRVNLMYEMSHSRSTIFNKGVLYTPTYFFIWTLILIRNIRAPPRINFIAELIGVFALINKNCLFLVTIFLFIVMTSLYSYLIFRVTAQLKSNTQKILIIYKKNYLILSSHIATVFLFTLNLTMLS